MEAEYGRGFLCTEKRYRLSLIWKPPFLIRHHSRRRFDERGSSTSQFSAPSMSTSTSSKSRSNMLIALSDCSICFSISSHCSLKANACAVLTVFLICLPLRASTPSRARHASVNHSGLTPAHALVMNTLQRSRLESIFKAWYLMARWIRDLMAGSNTFTRLVVRMRIPW